jgi:hypothetical protein
MSETKFHTHTRLQGKIIVSYLAYAPAARQWSLSKHLYDKPLLGSWYKSYSHKNRKKKQEWYFLILLIYATIMNGAFWQTMPGGYKRKI